MLLLLVVVPTGCSDQGGGGGGRCFAPLIGCAPPAPTTASATGNATAFRASLAPLLAALPSAAAAAEGFAALRSQSQLDPGRDRVHALGLCFGGDASDCHACLRAAATAATEGCANDTRRAGVWSDDGCLLAYYAGGDTAASSYTDGLELEQTLADLANALAQPKGQSLCESSQLPCSVHNVTSVLRFRH